MIAFVLYSEYQQANEKSTNEEMVANSTEEIKNNVLREENAKEEKTEEEQENNNSNVTEITAKNFFEDSLELQKNQIAISFKNNKYWLIDCYEDYFESQSKPISISNGIDAGKIIGGSLIFLHESILGFMLQPAIKNWYKKSESENENDNFSVLECGNSESGWKDINSYDCTKLNEKFALVNPCVAITSSEIVSFRFRTSNKGKYYYFSISY